MEIKWLEDFLSLVDTRNFSRSADLRYTTQPAFSRRIKSLEEWVGARLFDRRIQPITLTQAGERFRPTVEELLRRLYQAREERHHVFSTRLDTDQFEHCVQALLRGDCHFMLTHTHPSVDLNLPPAEFASFRVGADRLLPVMAPARAGEPMSRLPGTRERPVDYLEYAETSSIGRAVENVLSQRAEPPHLNRVFVSHLAAVLKSMACSGRGVAWLPESHIQSEFASGSLVLAGEAGWNIPVEILIYRSRDPLPPKSEEFWSFVTGDAPA